MIAKLTKKEDGKPIYVNSNALVAWDACTDGVGSRLVFDNDFAYLVSESPKQVKHAVQKCLGIFCSDSE